MSVLPRELRLRWGLSLSQRRTVLVMGDALTALASAFLALVLWAYSAPEPLSWEFVQARAYWLIIMPLGWMVLNIGAYDLHRPPYSPTAWREMLNAAGVAMALYVALFFFSPRNSLPRLAVLYFIVGAVTSGLAWRWLYARVTSSAYFQRRLLVVGAGWAGHEIIEALREFQPSQYTVVGVIDDDPLKHRSTLGGVPVLGGRDRLLPAVQALNASEVVLAINREIEGATFQTLLECRAQGVPIVRMLSLYEQITGRMPLEHLDADWVVAAYMDQNRVRLVYHIFKRLVDLLFALLGLAILAVMTPFIALAIRLESPGPILYRQTRLGQAGRPFTIFKFRTMLPDAEADGLARWASPDDDRVTRVGRFLRRTRLDEAPQFWNVLMGEMSLVGPRPERPEFIADLEKQIPFYRARLIVKPGLTGWAQVNYGYAATIADAALKLQWDLYYIKYRSIWLDVLILWRTVGVVLGFKGT